MYKVLSKQVDLVRVNLYLTSYLFKLPVLVTKILKVLELNYASSWRGGERQTIYNSIGLIDKGIHVSLICRSNSVLELKARTLGIKVFPFKNIFGVLSFLIFKSRDYQIIHAQTAQILTYCVLTKPFHQAKVVFTRRIDFIPKGWLTRLKYRLADCLVAVSKAVKSIVEDFAERPVTVISDIVVEHSIDKARALVLAKELKLKDGTVILGTMAALVAHKDPLTLIRAVTLLAKKREDFVFLHFGTGELEPQMKALINDCALGDKYKLMGFWDKPEDFFSILDIFVMSSREEGLGSAVLDAFLYKVPVVSTTSGGLGEITAKRAITCAAGDPASICSAIEFAIANPEQIAALVSVAHEYVTAFHNLSYVTDQYIRLFSNI